MIVVSKVVLPTSNGGANLATEIAASQGIKIFAPPRSRLSFFNSPYFAHFNHQAVDIYPPSDFAPSPVVGKIKYISEFNAPKSKQLNSLAKEYLIAVETPISSKYLVRVLHVKPWVRIGDEVEIGEPLGELVRSSYFDFWTDLHLHVEIKPSLNLFRAGGGVLLRATLKGELNGSPSHSNFKATIEVTKPEYVLVSGPNVRIGSFLGIPVFVGDKMGILDGGVPHYGFGGVMVPDKIKIGDQVLLGGIKIGRVVEVFADGFAKFKAEPFSVKLENLRMKGISCYIGLDNRYAWKLVPNEVERTRFSGSAEVVFGS